MVAGGMMSPDTPVGRLTDKEWGWIYAGMVFAWMRARVAQAAAEGRSVESAVRDGSAGAWDAGAIVSILPALADANIGIDWSQPLAAWPRETMVAFLGHAFTLINDAKVAADRGGGITRQHDAGRMSREANAGAGNPLVVPRELSDSVPF
jgi:hypothetical protein